MDYPTVPSASTRHPQHRISVNLYNKLTIYRGHGVKEYIVWRVYDQEIDWFILEAGEYVKLPNWYS